MPVHQITASAAKEFLDQSKAILIDVREPNECKEQSIKGSISMPLSTFSQDAFDELIERNIDKKIIIHCKAGGRSNSVCQKVIQFNPKLEVYNLHGGIMACEKVGFDIAAEPSCCAAKKMTIMQQTQLSIGVCVLMGALLGYIFSPFFLIIPAFFGAGLIWAGISGTCNLSLILAKMPWNK